MSISSLRIAKRWSTPLGALLLAVISAACWGSGTVLSRAALDSVPPLTLLLIQLSASVVTLWLFSAWRGVAPALHRRDLRAGLPGLLEPGLAYVLGISGLALTTASRSALISALEPIFVILFAWLWLREPLTWRLGLLAGVAVFGVTLVSASAGPLAGANASLGDLLVLLGTVIAAMYVVLTRRLLTHHAPLPLTVLQQTVGLLGVGGLWLGAAAAQHPAAAIPAAPLATILLAIVAGIIQFALAFWLYLAALQRLPASIAGFALTLTPLFGVAGGYLWLGERLTLTQGLGAVCIIGVAVLVALREKAPAARG